MNEANSGCGSNGRDFSSGWNCTPINQGWSSYSMISGRMPSGDMPEQRGMRFSGMSPDGILPEIIEYDDHPWFIGVQFHPELKSRPFEPHPLFASFVEAAVEQSRLV